MFKFNLDIKNKKGLRWCPILQKGADDLFQNVFLRSPAIFFDRKDKGLKISLTTSAMEKFPQVFSIEKYLKIIMH